MGTTIHRRDLIRRLRELGFAGPFSGGRHQFLVRGTLKLRIPNPHGANEISHGLLKEILAQARLTFADLGLREER